jgi:hypothetical protein
MRVAKFFSKAIVRRADRVPEACIQVFEQVLDRRLPKDLVDVRVKQQMILQSGGVLRELIRISDRCCDQAKLELQRQIRQQLTDRPLLKVDQAILEQVLTELQIEYAEPLGQKDFAMLKAIYQEFKPQNAEEQRFLDLLHGLYILEYRNALQWYDLNPIVRDLLIQEGILDGPD